MPKLPNEFIKVQTINDGVILHEAPVRVDSAGRFTVGLPADLKESAREFFDAGAFSREGMSFDYGRGGVPAISGPLLKKCVGCVREAIANHYAVATTSEDVLAYKYSSGLSYWKNRDGTITYNGVAPDADRKGNWAGAPSGAANDEKEGLLLCAAALVRKTHTRGSGKRVELVLWRPDNLQDDSDIRAKLNALSPGGSAEDIEANEDAWTIIPYDEKAALFFFRAIHSLCRIDDQLRTFFGDREKVAGAIASGGASFLLTSPER